MFATACTSQAPNRFAIGDRIATEHSATMVVRGRCKEQSSRPTLTSCTLHASHDWAYVLLYSVSRQIVR